MIFAVVLAMILNAHDFADLDFSLLSSVIRWLPADSAIGALRRGQPGRPPSMTILARGLAGDHQGALPASGSERVSARGSGRGDRGGRARARRRVFGRRVLGRCVLDRRVLGRACSMRRGASGDVRPVALAGARPRRAAWSAGRCARRAAVRSPT